MGSHNCTVTCDGNGIVGIPMEMPHGDRKSTRLNQSPCNLVCRLLLEKKKKKIFRPPQRHPLGHRLSCYEQHPTGMNVSVTHVANQIYYDIVPQPELYRH